MALPWITWNRYLMRHTYNKKAFQSKVNHLLVKWSHDAVGVQRTRGLTLWCNGLGSPVNRWTHMTETSPCHKLCTRVKILFVLLSLEIYLLLETTLGNHHTFSRFSWFVDLVNWVKINERHFKCISLLTDKWFSHQGMQLWSWCTVNVVSEFQFIWISDVSDPF